MVAKVSDFDFFIPGKCNGRMRRPGVMPFRSYKKLRSSGEQLLYIRTLERRNDLLKLYCGRRSWAYCSYFSWGWWRQWLVWV
jgi:hypothetical protein